MAFEFAELPGYAELFCASNFSFLHGASHAEQLVARAKQLNYAAIAITDECTLAGVVRAHVEAKAADLPLIVGSYFRLTNPDGSHAVSFIALATNRNGSGNLSELITLARTRAAKGTYILRPADLARPEKPYEHLKGLPDCLIIVCPEFPSDDRKLDAQVAWISATFGERAWVGLTLHARAMDDIHRGVVQAVAARHGLPLVATGQVTMHVRSRKLLQDSLTAVRLGKSVGECGYDLAPNAEQHLRSRLRLANLYPRRALEETLNIANHCSFSLDELRYEYPDELVPGGHTLTSYLRQETYTGAHRRFPGGVPHSVQQQIEHELQLIQELNYEPYFLTVYDIVRFARGEGILCQGRGSAANSAVCFCLGVTEVDPARSSMLFERFI
ncbi:Error-prone DNA polymerase (plasmid) [Pararobbsia alpina]